MKQAEKILTYEQAKELKWFCRNVAGTRTEFYDALKAVDVYTKKIDRLQITADMILEWCEKNNINMIGEQDLPEFKVAMNPSDSECAGERV